MIDDVLGLTYGLSQKPIAFGRFDAKLPQLFGKPLRTLVSRGDRHPLRVNPAKPSIVPILKRPLPDAKSQSELRKPDRLIHPLIFALDETIDAKQFRAQQPVGIEDRIVADPDLGVSEKLPRVFAALAVGNYFDHHVRGLAYSQVK